MNQKVWEVKDYSHEYNDLFWTEIAWERRVRWEEQKGFLWLHELIDYAQAYQLNRDKYRTYAEFVPEIVGFLRQVAADMEDYYLPKRALFDTRVVSTFPANGSVVDTNITKIVVVFSRPMQNAGGMESVKEDGILSIPLKTDSSVIAYLEWLKDTTQPEPDYEKYEKVRYWENPNTYVILLAEPLKPKSKYGIVFKYFADRQFFLGVNPYELIFETK